MIENVYAVDGFPSWSDPSAPPISVRFTLSDAASVSRMVPRARAALREIDAFVLDQRDSVVETIDLSSSRDDLLIAVRSGVGGSEVRTGSGDDLIHVESGSSNVIDGGSGDDRLSGGRGADTFVFRVTESGTDVIRGFGDEDRIRIDGSGAYVRQQVSDGTLVIDYGADSDTADRRIYVIGRDDPLSRSEILIADDATLETRPEVDESYPDLPATAVLRAESEDEVFRYDGSKLKMSVDPTEEVMVQLHRTRLDGTTFEVAGFPDWTGSSSQSRDFTSAAGWLQNLPRGDEIDADVLILSALGGGSSTIDLSEGSSRFVYARDFDLTYRTFLFGDGDDMFIAYGRNAGDLGGGDDTVVARFASGDTAASILDFYLGDGDDVFIGAYHATAGNQSRHNVYGGAGNDVITSVGGSEITLYGAVTATT